MAKNIIIAVLLVLVGALGGMYVYEYVQDRQVVEQDEEREAVEERMEEKKAEATESDDEKPSGELEDEEEDDEKEGDAAGKTDGEEDQGKEETGEGQEGDLVEEADPEVQDESAYERLFPPVGIGEDGYLMGDHGEIAYRGKTFQIQNVCHKDEDGDKVCEYRIQDREGNDLVCPEAVPCSMPLDVNLDWRAQLTTTLDEKYLIYASAANARREGNNSISLDSQHVGLYDFEKNEYELLLTFPEQTRIYFDSWSPNGQQLLIVGVNHYSPQEFPNTTIVYRLVLEDGKPKLDGIYDIAIYSSIGSNLFVPDKVKWLNEDEIQYSTPATDETMAATQGRVRSGWAILNLQTKSIRIE